jgi:N-carbamoyl-L-amino-acid hydrolase
VSGGDANALLAEIAGVGRDPDRGGYSRPVFSAAELELREWFARHAARRGLAVETDGNGIVWAWWDVAGPRASAGEDGRRGAILTGSHLDSVPGGGNLDGPLGVASALAAVDLLRERGVRPVRPLAIAVFPEEEGSRFGLACLGSRLISGEADPEQVRGLRDETGLSYAEAALAAGFDPSRIGPDPERLARIAAFVELHVEQGRGLADLGGAVALAGAILAHGRWHVRIEGRGDHAGATRMADRQDPVVVAAETVRALRRRALAVPEARGTVGRIRVVPGGTNVIASSAELWMDVRHRDEGAVRRIVAETVADARRAADEEGCTAIVTEQSFSPAVEFDAGLRDLMREVLPGAPVLDTGAGHDAGVLAAAIPTGMLFVRNPTGASHTPLESAEARDIDAGADALARVLERLLTS